MGGEESRVEGDEEEEDYCDGQRLFLEQQAGLLQLLGSDLMMRIRMTSLISLQPSVMRPRLQPSLHVLYYSSSSLTFFTL